MLETAQVPTHSLLCSSRTPRFAAPWSLIEHIQKAPPLCCTCPWQRSLGYRVSSRPARNPGREEEKKGEGKRRGRMGEEEKKEEDKEEEIEIERAESRVY